VKGELAGGIYYWCSRLRCTTGIGGKSGSAAVAHNHPIVVMSFDHLIMLKAVVAQLNGDLANRSFVARNRKPTAKSAPQCLGIKVTMGSIGLGAGRFLYLPSA